tara:strand:- start:344 stop:634 length:291 start_codon:yes stop_codon:yes gene_type:complete
MSKQSKRDLLIENINKKFPTLKADTAEEFYNAPDESGIWFRGTEQAEYDGLPFQTDPSVENGLYFMGTLIVLEDFLDLHGYFSEPYDRGTLMAYPK